MGNMKYTLQDTSNAKVDIEKVQLDGESQEIAKIETEVKEIYTRFSGLVIKDQADFDQSGFYLKDVKAKIKAVEEQQKEITRPFNEGLKRVRELFRRPLDLLNQAEETLRKGRIVFQQQQEKSRLEEERRLQELARKEEEKRRKQLEVRAQKAAERGDEEKATELREQKENVFIPAPIIESQVTKTEGIGMRKAWKFEIVDVELLPKSYMLPNEKLIGGIARSMKELANVPGVRFFAEDVEVVKLG